MHRTTFPEEGRSQFGGQHQRPCTTTNTPAPVMCGAMAAFSTRYGVLDDCPSRNSQMHRYSYLLKVAF